MSLKTMQEYTLIQQKQIDNLSSSELQEIDSVLMKNTSKDWRKIARVVGTTMMEVESTHKGLPDLFYGQRMINLVQKGELLSQGDITRMRYSEVKRP